MATGAKKAVHLEAVVKYSIDKDDFVSLKDEVKFLRENVVTNAALPSPTVKLRIRKR